MFSQWPPEPFYSGPPEERWGVHMSGSTHDGTSVSVDTRCFLHYCPDMLNVRLRQKYSYPSSFYEYVFVCVCVCSQLVLILK